jgi:hypothetical protein
MTSYSYLTAKERIRKLHADSLLNSDSSHLEPPAKVETSYYSRVNWKRQREISRPSSTCSLLCVPELPLGDFFTSKPTDSDFIDFEADARLQRRAYSNNAQLRATVAGGGGSAQFDFIEKNRQSLPVRIPKRAEILHLLALDGESPGMAKKFGLYNIQTIAGAPAKIAINRRDFLAR